MYDDRYIKTKIRTYNDKVYTNFCGLNVQEDDKECESFTLISTDSLPVYENKYYLQVFIFSIMDSNLKILYAMVAMFLQC